MFICEPLGIVAHIRVASVFRHLSLDIYIYANSPGCWSLPLCLKHYSKSVQSVQLIPKKAEMDGLQRSERISWRWTSASLEAIRLYRNRRPRQSNQFYTWKCEPSMEMLRCLVWKAWKFMQPSIYKKFSIPWSNEKSRQPRNYKISRQKWYTKEERINDQGFFTCRVNWEDPYIWISVDTLTWRS